MIGNSVVKGKISKVILQSTTGYGEVVDQGTIEYRLAVAWD